MIPGLDGLRAIAFLLVFAQHTDYSYFGWTGVLMFFVLSGFLITGILLRMKQSLSTKDYFKRFYGRRFLRIFPLYYFYLFAIAGLVAVLIALNYRPNYMAEFRFQLPYALAYVYDFFYASSSFTYHKFLDHFWSLSVEEQFYIVWPLLIMITPEKHLKKLFLGAVIAGPVFRLILTFIFDSHAFPFLTDYMPLGVYPLPFSHVDAFGLGAYISRFKIPRPKLQFAALIVIIPLVGYLSEYLATQGLANPSALGFATPLANAYKQIWGYTLLDYFFALVIYLVAIEKMFVRFLEFPVLRYLGRISYGLYVYHFSLTWFAGRLQDVFLMDYNTAKLVMAVVSLAATIAIASASYYFLERPILNLKEKYFSLHPQPKPT